MKQNENASLRIQPLFKTRIWGGRNLIQFGYSLPEGSIGECWGISGHPHGVSIILNGSEKGQPLTDVYRKHPEWFNNENKPTFPLLIKLIDAKADLSIQVHPDDLYAIQHEKQNGKHESWLVVHADDNARIQLGHRALHRQDFQTLVKENQWEQLLIYDTMEVDDVIDIQPGTLHALCAGTMVLEIQQSSDVTYRVYDYQRLDEQRHLRPLHLDQAFVVTTIPHLSPQRKKLNRLLLNQLQTLVDNPHYRIDALGLSEKQSFNLSNPHYQLGFVLEGFFILDNEMFKKGDYLILTSLQKNILTRGQGWLILATPQ